MFNCAPACLIKQSNMEALLTKTNEQPLATTNIIALLSGNSNASFIRLY